MSETLMFSEEDIDRVDTEVFSIQSMRVTALSNATPWFLDVRDDITEVARLKEDWDTYGSQTLTTEAKVRAIDLALFLQTTSLRNKNLPVVSPISGGGIQFSWKMPERELEIEVFHDGSMGYFLVDEHGEREGEIENVRSNELLRLVGLFTNPK